MTATRSWIHRHEVAAFYLLALVLISAAMAAAGATGIEALALFGVIGPAISAVIIAQLTGGKQARRELLGQLFKWRVSLKWYLVALFLLPGIAAIAITINTGSLPPIRDGSLFPQILILLVLMTGEEIGWRGFVLPRLQERYNALTASLILGVMWGVWHFPGYLGGQGVPLEMSFFVFLTWVIGATILMTWVYNHTHSVLLSVVMHVFSNLAFGALPLLPETTGEQSTFWIFLGLVWVTSAIVIVVYGPATLTGTQGFQPRPSGPVDAA